MTFLLKQKTEISPKLFYNTTPHSVTLNGICAGPAHKMSGIGGGGGGGTNLPRERHPQRYIRGTLNPTESTYPATMTMNNWWLGPLSRSWGNKKTPNCRVSPNPWVEPDTDRHAERHTEGLRTSLHLQSKRSSFTISLMFYSVPQSSANSVQESAKKASAVTKEQQKGLKPENNAWSGMMVQPKAR